MKTAMKKILVIFYAAFLMSTAVSGFCAEGEADRVPGGDFTVKVEYEPGMGEPLGKVLLVMGDGIILHQNEKAGYQAQKGLPLYKNDTVMSLERSRVRFSLNDGSVMTLASNTVLTVNRSVYEPESKTRSTFLGLDKGKARFWAVKLRDYRNSEFNVKTKTAVAGVRGSDFVVEGSDDITEVTTLKDTLLALTSLFDPEADPLMLSDFERSRIPKGALPTTAERVGLDEVEAMMREFLFEGERFDPDNMIDVTDERDEESAEAEQTEETGKTGAAETKTADEIYKAFSESAGVRIPTEVLVKPDVTGPKEEYEGIALEEVVKKSEVTEVENDTKAQETSTREEANDTSAREEMSTLPGPVEGP